MTVTGMKVSGRAGATFGVVILNWNNASDTISCLDALASADPSPQNIVVVDNGSADDSIEQIERWLASEANPTGVSNAQFIILIRAGANLGFAGGTNRGIDWLISKTSVTHIVLLNNDATVSPSFFSDLADSIEEIGVDAIVGPTIYEDPDRDRVWYAGAHEIPLRALVKHDTVRPDSMKPRETDFVSGCAMIISREVFRKIGNLSECYFPAYFEDGDFCHRAVKAGFPVMYAPKPVAYHKVGSTVRAANIEAVLVHAKNRLRVVYVRRNYTGMQRALALGYLAITKPARFAVDVLTGHPREGWAVISGASAGFLTRDIGTQ